MPTKHQLKCLKKQHPYFVNVSIYQLIFPILCHWNWQKLNQVQDMLAHAHSKSNTKQGEKNKRSFSHAIQSVQSTKETNLLRLDPHPPPWPRFHKKLPCSWIRTSISIGNQPSLSRWRAWSWSRPAGRCRSQSVTMLWWCSIRRSGLRGAMTPGPGPGPGPQPSSGWRALNINSGTKTRL